MIYQRDDELKLFERERVSPFQYSDGTETEKHIYEAVLAAKNRSTFSPELLQAITDWPSEYHFSRRRHCLLRPLEIKAGDKVLELGCGAGAITRYLGEIGTQVYAIEGSSFRARVTAERCRDLPNVSVFVDEIEHFETEERFDWVLMIGVLEYAPRFSKETDPIQSYLRVARRYLEPNGRLVVAIENKLGLKYFNGCSEDHIGTAYVGIQGLYESDSPTTFGRQELIAALQKSGLKHSTFHYPFPDFKLPTVILTERALSCQQFDAGDLLVQCHARDYTGWINRSFDDALAFRELYHNQLVGDLSNSFLVIASTHPLPDQSDLLATAFSSYRIPEFATQTRFLLTHGELRVLKEPLLDVPDRVRSLPDGSAIHNKLTSSRYVWGQQLLWRVIAARAKRGTVEDIVDALRPWFRFLLQQAGTSTDFQASESQSGVNLGSLVVAGSLLDCTPANVIDNNRNLTIIDFEWELDCDLPLGWIVTRGVFYSLSVGVPISNAFATVFDIVAGLCREVNISMSKAQIEEWLAKESQLQSVVCGRTMATITAEHPFTGFSKLLSEVARLEEANTSNASQLIEQADLRVALEQQASELRVERNRVQAGLDVVSAEHERVRARLANLTSEYERLCRDQIESKTQLRRQKARLEILGEERDAERREAEQLQQEIIRYRRHLLGAEAQLKAVHASLSWRITSPIRSFKSRFPWPAQQLRRLRMVLGWIAHFRLRAGIRDAILLRKNVRLLEAASELFDRNWYLDRNPDVAAAGIDPLVHYLRQGVAEGRDPNPFFDTDWYLKEYSEVARAGLNPLGHYMAAGAAEGLDPSPLFDTDWYVSRNSDVAASGVNPLLHFLKHGHAEHRLPRPAEIDLSQSGGCAEALRMEDGLKLRTRPRVAVMLHVFYPDLLVEMLDATLVIPWPFDILLSTPAEQIVNTAREWASEHENVRLIAEVVPNRGRDVAPLLVTFGPRLLDYDAFCHLHSKKSLYSGSDQKNWREYLVSSLLGTEAKFRYILHLLMQRDYGVVYAKTFHLIPYSAHTWLSSRGAGELLFRRLGLDEELHGYLDFPVGTMFWARPAAVSQLLDGRFHLEDFAEEQGQNDGTLAHAVERSIVPLARQNGWNFAELDFDAQVLRNNCGSKNLEQYHSRSASDLKHQIDKFDLISFDIFDTLMTRAMVRPDYVFTVIERTLDKRAEVPTRFAHCRKEGERIARAKSSRHDVNLDAIYREVAQLPSMTEMLANEAHRLELQLEYELVMPRPTLVEAYQHALSTGKRVILVSDMYLPAVQVARMLEKVGVSGWSELYLSCEIGLRKDTGELWDWIIAKEHLDRYRMLHIGDNEQSDVQMPGDRRIDLYHVLSPVNLFALSRWGRLLISRLGRNWRDATYLGPIIATLYNDPFRKVEFD
jgi:SAM-dependent methyltransferase/FMN phosphatase YigB (HAD superfamily)